MSFPEQLKNARLACGLTQQEVAQALNIDKTTYSSYETGRRQPDVARLRQLARLLEVSVDQLLELAPRLGAAPTPEEMGQVKKYRLLDLHGRELVDLVLDKEYQRMARAPEKEEKGWITYINCYDLAVSAGTGEPWGDTGYKTRLEIPGGQVPENAHFCVRVNGDSMEPAYKDGDMVFVERLEGCVNEGEIGIFLLNGEGYIKRLGDRELLSLNPAYGPIPLRPHDDFRCQGRVLGKVCDQTGRENSSGLRPPEF